MNRAYVGVDYPTTGPRGIDGAFATFTSGAGRDARRQDHLTTAVDIGADLVDVVPTRRTVQLVAFAPDGRAVGASAVVQLVLLGVRANSEEVEVAMTGDLYLTRPGHTWQVFGYDLRRSTGAPGSYAHSQDKQGQRGSGSQPMSRPVDPSLRRSVAHRVRRSLALMTILALTLVFLPDAGTPRIDATLVRVEGAQAVDAETDVVWILALGSDARPGQPVLSSRADAIQLVGINAETGHATIIGIPRDSYVDIPGYGRNKINAAMVYGGRS